MGFAMPIVVDTTLSFVLDSDPILPFESSFGLDYYSIRKPPYKFEGVLVQMVEWQLQPQLPWSLFEIIIQKYEPMPNQTQYEL